MLKRPEIGIETRNKSPQNSWIEKKRDMIGT
jgi:hypothetical protein